MKETAAETESEGTVVMVVLKVKGCTCRGIGIVKMFDPIYVSSDTFTAEFWISLNTCFMLKLFKNIFETKLLLCQLKHLMSRLHLFVNEK